VVVVVVVVVLLGALVVSVSDDGGTELSVTVGSVTSVSGADCVVAATRCGVSCRFGVSSTSQATVSSADTTTPRTAPAAIRWSGLAPAARGGAGRSCSRTRSRVSLPRARAGAGGRDGGDVPRRVVRDSESGGVR
ncbi:MAG TPA: hypothetical protein VIL00_18910, partial [Pseudonocardiaceae bacterium]